MAKPKELSRIVELGERIMNIREIVSVYCADGEKGFAIMLDYGNEVMDLLAYSSERERNRNFNRIQEWLHEYPEFLTVKDKIINLLKFQFLQCIGKNLVFQMSGKKIEVAFLSPQEAEKVMKEFKEATYAKAK